MVYKFRDKKAGDTSTQTRTGISANKELFSELHNSIAKKLKSPRHTHLIEITFWQTFS